jgi:hypothetical protein
MDSGRSGGKTVAGVGLLMVVGLAILLLVKGLYPADLPESRNPDFVDNIFDNRGVLWAARLLLVSAAGVLAFGGVFIVVSIGIRMKNEEWLRRAGPFEISEPLGKTKDEINDWRQAALTNQEEVANLRQHLEKANALVEKLRNP